MIPAASLPRMTGALPWLGFFGAVLAAWGTLWWMTGLSGLDAICGVAASGGVAGFVALFGMWAVMMAAMMLPTLVPTLNAYDDLIRPGLGTRAGWAGLVAGYLAVWVGVAAVFAAAQAALLAAGIVDDLGTLVSRTAAGLVLAGAGLWQFTAAKTACHDACLSPMTLFLARWRPGLGGGARMGARIGGFCVGCCWAYMALGFVGGTMNLAWMGVATLLMIFEKLPEVGRHVVRPAGAAMIAGGLWMGVT